MLDSKSSAHCQPKEFSNFERCNETNSKHKRNRQENILNNFPEYDIQYVIFIEENNLKGTKFIRDRVNVACSLVINIRGSSGKDCHS